jgi:hypothetical protein
MRVYNEHEEQYTNEVRRLLERGGTDDGPVEMPESPTFSRRTEEYAFPSQHIAGMFHLTAGRGIEKYRHYLIERLGSMGEVGERVWNSVIGSTEMMEQNLSRDTDKVYPRTLQSASEVYG